MSAEHGKGAASIRTMAIRFIFIGTTSSMTRNK
jgi:hypothetical protein